MDNTMDIYQNHWIALANSLALANSDEFVDDGIYDKRKTSENHPYSLTDIAYFTNIFQNLNINSNENNNYGRLCVSISPGKQDGNWYRNLDQDIANIKDANINIIVCLLEWPEMRQLNIIDYPRKAKDLGFWFYHLPIRDGDIPRLRELKVLIPLLVQNLNIGKKILIHCRSGLGRAGTISACCLTHFGFNSTQAIQMVRAQRPKAIQNSKQENCVVRYYERCIK